MTAVTILLALALALPLALTAIVYATWRPAPPDPDAFALPRSTIVRVLVGEWIGAIVGLIALPLRLRDESGRGEGALVFVPEARCSAATFWLLRRRLRALGWSSGAVAGAATVGELDGATAAIDACLARVARPDIRVVLVGHGLGGIVACRFAAMQPQRVRHVVTLSTPHQGSTAVPYRLLGAAAVARDAASLIGTPTVPIDITSIYSDYDPWLEPVDNAYCPGAFNITARGMGHFATLLSPRVAELVLENLAAAIDPRRRPRHVERVPPCSENVVDESSRAPTARPPLKKGD